MGICWKARPLPALQLLLIVILCQSEPCSGISRPSNIVLENNGYRNIVVAIHDSVTENASLIDTLKITTFCEDDERNQLTLHNYETPSRHNRLCEHRSTWDIISHTEDFSGAKNSPRNMSESELVPQFKLVKATSRRKRISSSAPEKKYQKELHTRIDIHVVEADMGRSYVELYVHVMHGFLPVVGMKVMATIKDPQEKQTTVVLYDNGAGIDMTKDDGIYSRAFTNLSLPGRYQVSAHVENAADTFVLDTVVDDFDIPWKLKTVKRSLHAPTVRQLTGHIFDIARAKDLSTTMDVIPPSRIADLHVVEISKVNKTAILSWTAPGDNLDDDKVDHYELFSALNIEDVRKLLSVNTKHGLPMCRSIQMKVVPNSGTFGSQEHYVWRAPPDQVDSHSRLHYAIVVRGVDHAGNAGKLSNIVTFSLS